MRYRFAIALSIALISTSPVRSQSAPPSLDDLLASPSSEASGTTSPPPVAIPLRNAGDVAKLRLYHDKTFWAKEIVAQKFDSAIVSFWDKLRAAADPMQVLEELEADTWQVGSQSERVELANDVQQTTFQGSEELTKDRFRELVARYRDSGFEITGSEFRQTHFEMTDRGEASSTVRVRLLAKAAGKRFMLQAIATIRWSEAEAPVPRPASVAFSDIEILDRSAAPVLSKAMSIPYPHGVRQTYGYPHTIRPILIVDLNGDRLPEIVLPAANEVWWNAGKWRFAKRDLVKHPVAGITATIACDLDGDRHIDLLAANRGAMLWYRGDSTGTFNAQPAVFRFREFDLRSATAMTAGDVDADGDLDIFVGQSKETHLLGDFPAPYFDAVDGYGSVLLQNDGSGRYTNATANAGLADLSRRRVSSSTLVDLDHDGDLDLLTTSDFAGTELYLNDGKGTFSNGSRAFGEADHALGQGHLFGDFNNDGLLDLLSLATSSVAAQRLDSMGLGRSDFSHYDQLRGTMSRGSRLYLNEADAEGNSESWLKEEVGQDALATGWPIAGASSDFDRDGKLDIFITNGRVSGDTTRDYDSRFWCHDVYFEPNTRPEGALRQHFARMLPLFGKVLSWHGFERNSLLMRDGDNRMRDISYLLMDQDPYPDSRCAVTADLDLDGRMDLIYEEVQSGKSESVLRILKNTSEDANHWIGLHLADSSKSVGGRATVVLANDRQRTQHVLIGHGVGVQQTGSIHFGLGAYDQVQAIRFDWPDGTVTEISNPAIDRYHTIAVEPGR